MAIYKDTKPKKKFSFGKLLLVLFLLAVVAVGAVGYLVWGEIKGTAEGESIVVTIPEGASTQTIANILQNNGLVSNALIFRVYSRYVHADGSYQHGDHLLYYGSSYDDMISSLQDVTYKVVETVDVTFPEGTTALAMAIKLEEAGLCSIEEFMNVCNNDSFDVSFFGEISNNSKKFIRLEGFLFPDTYSFAVDSTAYDIVQKMLKNFEKRVYTDDFKSKVAKSGLTLEENIILASIIEREALGDDNYGMVSGVFHNRMNNTTVFPCLESCTSTEHLPGNFIYGVLGYYYNGDIEPYVRNIPRDLIAAYDTYVTPGLPVGAICNPGAKAIDATLTPTQHDYYFFVTDKYGVFYWGRTIAEHEANIRKMHEANNG